ncbi:MAG: MerR family transcriptional regulator, partial [Rickettsiales bacterium]|nr:MerR family transcriptional regulator [Rickettsiales bacterium]
MQFDLLQNELFPTDDTTTASSKKRRPNGTNSPKEPDLLLDPANLPPLPDSLLSALSQPPDAEFHDEPEGDDVTDEIPAEFKTLAKSPGALKTISEVAAILDVPQHVLRFWESRFSQIRPMKLRGG